MKYHIVKKRSKISKKSKKRSRTGKKSKKLSKRNEVWLGVLALTGVAL